MKTHFKSYPKTISRVAAPPRHIVVPVDFSSESTRALKFGMELASRYDAAITLVHVVEPIHYVHDFGYGPVRRSSPNQGLMQHAKRRLRGFGRRHGKTVQGWNVVVKSGSACNQIVKTAQERGADLIVMPTRGLTHHAPDELGSTAERVVRHASCPVITLRNPKTFENRGPRALPPR
jgi:nucleotide-binding universal stress UspA family protein